MSRKQWGGGRKSDDNQRAIVSALREIPGVTVQTGHDDLLVGYRGVNLWFECKRPEAVSTPAKRKAAIKPSQIKLESELYQHWRRLRAS